jgi:hypothetical protein
VQAENIQQAETLVKLTEKLESLNSDVQDTQQLISALHSEFQTIQPSAMERANIMPSVEKLEDSCFCQLPTLSERTQSSQRSADVKHSVQVQRRSSCSWS